MSYNEEQQKILDDNHEILQVQYRESKIEREMKTLEEVEKDILKFQKKLDDLFEYKRQITHRLESIL